MTNLLERLNNLVGVKTYDIEGKRFRCELDVDVFGNLIGNDNIVITIYQYLGNVRVGYICCYVGDKTIITSTYNETMNNLLKSIYSPTTYLQIKIVNNLICDYLEEKIQYTLSTKYCK